jgi:O-antigen/teichoic acid export membrane protein
VHGGGIIALTAVVAGKEAAVLLVGWAALRPRRHPEVRGRTLLARGMWVAISGTIGVLMFRAGTLVIGGVGSVGALATYVVATRFLDAGVTVAHTVGFGLGPGMATLAGDPPGFRAAARRYLAAVGVLGVAVAVVGPLVAGPLTTIPFGERWAVAVPAVRMAAVTGLPILLAYVSITVLVARNQVRWMALSTLVSTVVALATTIALVAVHPTAISAVTGTAAGATTLALLLLWGLRDLLRPARD